MQEQRRISKSNSLLLQGEGQLSRLDMKKLPKLMHNLMHANFRIMHNQVSITFGFLCALIFLQALQIKEHAVAASSNFVHNFRGSYRMLAMQQNQTKTTFSQK